MIYRVGIYRVKLYRVGIYHVDIYHVGIYHVGIYHSYNISRFDISCQDVFVKCPKYIISSIAQLLKASISTIVDILAFPSYLHKQSSVFN